MYPVLLHIYGPFSIHSYGVAILIGFFLFFFLTKRKAVQQQLITDDMAYIIAQHAILAAVIMGKIVHYMSNWEEYSDWIEIFTVWNGGFSILGSMIGVFIYIPYLLYYYNIAILKLFDISALYAALLHFCGRIGCFFAGCCGGAATESFFSMLSSTGNRVYPSQLCSAAIFLIIFIILRYIAARYCSKSGQLIMLYIILASLERFVSDFIRNDRIFVSFFPVFSCHQWLALIMLNIGAAGFIWCSLRKDHITDFSH